MDNSPHNTKLQLILAAGEIFAEHGFEGASIRAIAEKAGANIAAINYHFGSKENLYKETVLFSHKKRGKIQDILSQEDPNILKSRQGVEKIIRKIVQLDFHSFVSPDRPNWSGRLLLRSFFDSAPPFKELIRDEFLPNFQFLKNLALNANPTLSDQEAHFWALSLIGKISVYSFLAEPVLMTYNKENYDPSDIEAAIDHITKTLVRELFPPEKNNETRSVNS